MKSIFHFWAQLSIYVTIRFIYRRMFVVSCILIGFWLFPQYFLRKVSKYKVLISVGGGSFWNGKVYKNYLESSIIFIGTIRSLYIIATIGPIIMGIVYNKSIPINTLSFYYNWSNRSLFRFWKSHFYIW